MKLLYLFYKEWVKTRGAFFISLLAGLAVVTSIFTTVENRMTMRGGQSYMMSVLYDTPPLIYYNLLHWVPLLVAGCIGVAQYLPEVKNSRIRLTLHLPVDNRLLTAGMVLFGWLLITLSNGIVLGFFTWKNTSLFPVEITAPVQSTVMPWFVASYLVYNYIAMAAIEPVGYRRLIYGLTGFVLLSFYINDVSFHGAYGDSLPVLILLAVLSCPLVMFSIHRLSKGER